jgi:hypothetical protein
MNKEIAAATTNDFTKFISFPWLLISIITTPQSAYLFSTDCGVPFLSAFYGAAPPPDTCGQLHWSAGNPKLQVTVIGNE